MVSKKEYITNQLKKTFSKKYENYCVTRIYNLVNNLNLQIVTQQLFKRGKNKIALADIYFPQINLWVEIDEQHHDAQKKADNQRTEDVLINNKIKKLAEVVQVKELEKADIQPQEMENLEEEKASLSNFSKTSERIIAFLHTYQEASSLLYKAKKELSYINDDKLRLFQENQHLLKMHLYEMDLI